MEPRRSHTHSPGELEEGRAPGRRKTGETEYSKIALLGLGSYS